MTERGAGISSSVSVIESAHRNAGLDDKPKSLTPPQPPTPSPQSPTLCPPTHTHFII